MKASIYVNESYKNEQGESMVYLRIFINKKYLLIPLEFHVAPGSYDKESQKIIRGRKKVMHNHIVKDALGRASNIILKYKFNKKPLTREIFEREFKTPDLLTDFYAFMEHEIKKRRGEITETSEKQHLTILNKLKQFTPSLLMADLDEDFLNKFKNHLKNKLKNRTNTVNNALKVLKVYVNMALKQELINKSPFEYFKIKKEKTYPEFLTENELKEMISLYEEKKLKQGQQNVLRWFIFGCQTGLRINDLRNARHENIRNGILSIHPIKTQNVNNRRVDIPLTKLAKKLIKDENPHRVNGNIFDCISEQKMRKNLKNIISIAEINKDVCWHTSRHTFATLFLKKSTSANGIIMLQRLLGHSSIESTMIYTHILNDDLKDAMDEFVV